MPTNPTERVLAALPEDRHAYLTPYQWYTAVNELRPMMSLAAFCEQVRKLLDIGFISRATATGDAQGDTIVVRFQRTNER